MKQPTDNELADGLGLAHGFDPNHKVTEPIRQTLARLLDWPAPLITPQHQAAYVNGFHDGQERRKRLDANTL